jgi:hypothetical protein
MSIHVTAEQVDPFGKTVWTTVTNYGYRLYTLNMLKSLAPFGHSVLLLCLDRRSATWFEQKGYQVFTVDEPMERFCAWNTEGYDTICYLKLVWIYRLLSLHRNVLMIDGDIVFLKNPAEDVQKWEQSRFDGWIQNDAEYDSATNNLCTGYLFIRSTPNMIDLYNCTSEAGLVKYEKCAFDNNDQTYFNMYVKPFARIQPLPLEHYPNGRVFYKNPDVLRTTAIMVHFNWVQGHIKMAKMKEHKMWLLTPMEEI